jgi:hypothetical protein
MYMTRLWHRRTFDVLPASSSSGRTTTALWLRMALRMTFEARSHLQYCS